MARRDATLYVSHIPVDVADAVLAELFGQVGTVRSLRIPADQAATASDAAAALRGRFGFVEMDSPAAATYAARVLDGTALLGSALRVEAAGRRDARTAAGGQVFIRPLPDDVDDADLCDLGSVAAPGFVDAEVKRDAATDRSRGYGFVYYATLADAEAGARAVQGAILGGRALAARLSDRTPRKMAAAGAGVLDSGEGVHAGGPASPRSPHDDVGVVTLLASPGGDRGSGDGGGDPVALRITQELVDALHREAVAAVCARIGVELRLGSAPPPQQRAAPQPPQPIQSVGSGSGVRADAPSSLPHSVASAPTLSSQPQQWPAATAGQQALGASTTYFWDQGGATAHAPPPPPSHTSALSSAVAAMGPPGRSPDGLYGQQRGAEGGAGGTDAGQHALFHAGGLHRAVDSDGRGDGDVGGALTRPADFVSGHAHRVGGGLPSTLGGAADSHALLPPPLPPPPPPQQQQQQPPHYHPQFHSPAGGAAFTAPPPAQYVGSLPPHANFTGAGTGWRQGLFAHAATHTGALLAAAPPSGPSAGGEAPALPPAAYSDAGASAANVAKRPRWS